MTLFNGMYYFILLFTLITSVYSWPVFEYGNGPDLNLALSSQPANSSTNNNIITDHTIKISRIVNTTLGGIAALFTLTTYFFLMRYTLVCSNEIILPARFLAHNVGGILSAWAAENHDPSSTGVAESCDPGDRPHNPANLGAWKMFLKSPFPAEDRPPIHMHSGVGHSDERITDDEFSDDEFPEPEVLGLKTFSPTMRSLIQIAVWNSANFWIVLIVITNTLVYNGFFTNNITTDGIIRLLLVGLYAIANIVHQIRCTILLYRNFSLVISQASWTIVLNDLWICSNGLQHEYLMAFNTQLLGATERSHTYSASENMILDEDRGGESRLDKFIKPQRETDLRAYEKATDSALDRALANVAVLVGICLAAALAPWTSVQASNSTSAQLGSYALLLSISTGFLALMSSMGHLNNASESARKLLEYQEFAIMSHFDIHEIASPYELSEHLYVPRYSVISPGQSMVQQTLFGRGTSSYPPRCLLTFWGHLRSIKGPRQLLGLLLGPALMLVPRLYGIRQPLKDTSRGFKITVDDREFLYELELGKVTCIGRADPNASSPETVS